jgi:tRNA A37 N6-isopentenylltransferase MiaA
MKTETHRFVRNQATSFRKLEGVEWFDLDTVQEHAVVKRVAAFLA